MSIDLHGKRALVTGAGHGIGKAAAVALAAAGADVVVHYGHSADEASATVDEIKQLGRRAVAIGADVTVPDAVTGMVAEAVEFLGGLDILVTNAGHLVERKSIAEMDPALWHAVMDVNVTSTFLTCRAALHALAETRGVIVTMSSVAAHNGGGAGAAAYAASKAAILGFTKGLAKEIGPLGVRVNAVAPGFIDGTRFHATFTAREAVPAIISSVPLGRAGTPEEVAGTIVFLASPLSGYISGETIDITGAAWMR